MNLKEIIARLVVKNIILFFVVYMSLKGVVIWEVVLHMYLIIYLLLSIVFYGLQTSPPALYKDRRKVKLTQPIINTVLGLILLSSGFIIGVVILISTILIEIGYIKGKQCYINAGLGEDINDDDIR